jgi:hypothetical protein
MEQGFTPKLPSRRNFLAATGGLLAATAATPRAASALVAGEASASSPGPSPQSTARKIPIGVFDPAFAKLSLD